MRKTWLSSFLVVGLVATFSTVASAGLDGIVTAGEYDHQWTVQGWNSQSQTVNAGQPTATLYMRQDASNNLYVALVLPKTYVDNSYGGSGFTSAGWTAAGKNHNLSDLTGSDQATFLLKKNNGTSFFGGDMDYLNASGSTYSSGGFTAGDGGITTGTSAMVGGAQSSMGYNFLSGGNSSFTTHSPTLTSNALGNPIASGSPNWVYDVVYEFEILAGSTTFGNQSVLTGSGASSGLINGFGFELTFVHASPNMYGTNQDGYHIVLTPGVVINPTGTVPLPAAAWMGGLMMLGIVAETVRRRRRNALLA
jgi:hypothetical protein